MDDIAARRAAEALLAEHKANLRFKPLGPPQAPATISDAYDIQQKFVALLRGEHGATWVIRSGLHRLRCRRFAELTIRSQVLCSQDACIDPERPSGVRISATGPGI